MATDKNRKVELLAPAGNMEKLEIAMHYGADAVYLGGKDFSLRNFSGNFSFNELKTAIQVAHNQQVKVYVACNIFSRNFEQGAIKDYLEKSGYSIVDMDRAVASVERLILVRLDDIMERIWDEVDDDPDFLQSCDFDE